MMSSLLPAVLLLYFQAYDTILVGKGRDEDREAADQAAPESFHQGPAAVSDSHLPGASGRGRGDQPAGSSAAAGGKWSASAPPAE